MPRLRNAPTLGLVFALVLAAAGSAAQVTPRQSGLQAPNVVAISPRLVTSGQPTAESLAQLGAQGFDAVIYLAPNSVADAVPDEAGIVRRQGLAFVNIPIRFGHPTDADFQVFVEAMDRFRDRKLLVHCQVNMRASSMTFLYRVIVDREAPERAYDAVAQVWSPSVPWKQLIVSKLSQAGISFDPY